MLRKPIAPEPQKTVAQHFEEEARKLVERASLFGLVITVSQIPGKPLAMGNYETVVGVRQARKKAIDSVGERIASSSSAAEQQLSQLTTELERAYRCIQGMHNALTTGRPLGASELYHSLTIAAAKRFVFDGALDGSRYFEGKGVDVLHAALRLPAVEANDASN